MITAQQPANAAQKKGHPLAPKVPPFHFYGKAWKMLSKTKEQALLDPHIPISDYLAVRKSVRKLKAEIAWLAIKRAALSFGFYIGIHGAAGYTAYNPSFGEHGKTVENAAPTSQLVVESVIQAIPVHKRDEFTWKAIGINYTLAMSRMTLEQFILNKRGYNMDAANQPFGSYLNEILNQGYKLLFTHLKPEEQLRFHLTSAWGEIVRMGGDLVILALGSKLARKARAQLDKIPPGFQAIASKVKKSMEKDLAELNESFAEPLAPLFSLFGKLSELKSPVIGFLTATFNVKKYMQKESQKLEQLSSSEWNYIYKFDSKEFMSVLRLLRE